MEKETTYYHLKKPEREDFYDIEIQNENMDIIDGAMKELNNQLEGVVSQETLQNIENKLGSTNDKEDTGSIFAKLNTLFQWFTSHWTINRAGKIDSIPTISSNLSTLAGNLGTKASAPNSNGDAIARIAALNNKILDGMNTLDTMQTKYTQGTVKFNQFGFFQFNSEELEKEIVLGKEVVESNCICIVSGYHSSTLKVAYYNGIVNGKLKIGYGGQYQLYGYYMLLEFY